MLVLTKVVTHFFCSESMKDIGNSSQQREDDIEDRDIVGDLFNGRVFNTLAEAEECFKAYGKRIGFGIRIKTTRMHAKSNDICSRLYQCHRSGHPSNRAATVEDKGKSKRDIFTGTGCKC